MFEQHPVPQQISSYQFRLVGDMTLKQFFQLAGGAVIGLLIYASPLPSIFKWPLIIFFVVAGAAFAFLPLQERPLSEWLAAFFRAIYGPTVFTWEKRNIKDVYFTNNTLVQDTTSPTTRITDASVAKLEASENKFLNSIGGLFGVGSKAAAPTVGNLFVATPQTPQIKVESKSPGFVLPLSGTSQMQTTGVSPVMGQNTTIASQQASFSPEAAPPMPPSMPNIIVGQTMTLDGKIVDNAIIEVKDFQGRPVRALKTNRLGHFMIVTPLQSGKYTLTIEKEGHTFEPVAIELHGTIVPPIAIKTK